MLLTLAIASAKAGTVAVSIFSGSLPVMKNDISVSASSVLPEPLGPKIFNRGRHAVLPMTISRKSVAM